MVVPTIRVSSLLFIFIKCFVNKIMCDIDMPSVSIEDMSSFRIMMPSAIIFGGNFKDSYFYIQDIHASTTIFILPRIYATNGHGDMDYEVQYNRTGNKWKIQITNKTWNLNRIIVNIFDNSWKVNVHEIITKTTSVKVILNMENGLQCETLLSDTHTYKLETVACHFTCNSAITSIHPNGKHYAHICQNQLIFEETFDRLSPKVWQHERRLSRSDQEYAFVRYQLGPTKILAQGGLVIKPFLLSKETTTLNTGVNLFQEGCTETSESLCLLHAATGTTPPIVSARINTKNHFAFKYGVIEIRAKMPIGDWLYPELLLEPYQEKYGKEGYRSGVVRVAFARGNLRLRSGERAGTDIGNRLLSAGLLLDQFSCREQFVYTHTGSLPWGAKFHDYRVTWLRDEIKFSVDGVEFGSINATTLHKKMANCSDIAGAAQLSASTESLAPFDQEFYISVGVGVGGVTDFPDHCVTGEDHKILWRWSSSKAIRYFWDDRSNWYRTWKPEEAQLVVQHVKVWAV